MGSVYFSDPAMLVLNVCRSSNKWSANNAAIPIGDTDNMVVCDLDSDINWQPDYPMNDYRSIKEEFFVVVEICTHLGGVPHYKPDDRIEVKQASFFCT